MFTEAHIHTSTCLHVHMSTQAHIHTGTHTYRCTQPQLNKTVSILPPLHTHTSSLEYDLGRRQVNIIRHPGMDQHVPYGASLTGDQNYWNGKPHLLYQNSLVLVQKLSTTMKTMSLSLAKCCCLVNFVITPHSYEVM